MRFAFHFTGCAREVEGGLWTRGQFGRFVDALASQVDSVDLVLDETTESSSASFESRTDYRILGENVRFVSLGPHLARGGPVSRLVHIGSKLPRLQAQWDFFLMREPSRRSPFLRWATPSVPKVLLLGGDYRFQKDKGLDGWAGARLRFFDGQLRRAAASSLVFVNNEVLYDAWAETALEIHLTRTTTLTEEDLVETPRLGIPRDRPVRLLYVGRIDAKKGLSTLLGSVTSLRCRGVDVELRIAGSGEPSALADIEHRIVELGLAQAVELMGYVAFDDVLALYRWADASVLPTEAENLSRTIWEAMSQGCPVVTTPVGGQGRAFVDRRDVLFANPGDPDGFASRIAELLADEALVAALSRRGLELAGANTVELRARELLDATAAWLGRSSAQ